VCCRRFLRPWAEAMTRAGGSTPDGGVSGCYSYRPAPARVGRTGVPSPCRVPPRRAGNFLLLAQKKVTKEECLRQTPLSSFFSLRTPGPAGDLTARGRSPQQPARTLRARCASPLVFDRSGAPMRTRGLGNRAMVLRFNGSEVKWCSGAVAQRSGSDPFRRCEASRGVRASGGCDASRGVRSPAGPGMRSALNELRGVCLQALFFGDFLLCQQKKVTRPPGRDPAG
jgi:hypothetical protein